MIADSQSTNPILAISSKIRPGNCLELGPLRKISSMSFLAVIIFFFNFLAAFKNFLEANTENKDTDENMLKHSTLNQFVRK